MTDNDLIRRGDAARIAEQWATDFQRQFGAGGPAAAIRSLPAVTPPHLSADLLDAAAHAMMKWADAIEWERNDEFEAFKRHCRRATLRV